MQIGLLRPFNSSLTVFVVVAGGRNHDSSPGSTFRSLGSGGPWQRESCCLAGNVGRHP